MVMVNIGNYLREWCINRAFACSHFWCTASIDFQNVAKLYIIICKCSALLEREDGWPTSNIILLN